MDLVEHHQPVSPGAAANAHVERRIGRVRRECLDRLLIVVMAYVDAEGVLDLAAAKLSEAAPLTRPPCA